MEKKGLLLVFSGPSGAGKGTICRAVKQKNPSLRLSISATTRPPRKGEVDGVDYFFLKEKEFKKMIEGGRLLEWAEVYGNYYGTPVDFVQAELDRGNDVILEIDTQGALQVKKKFPEAVLIFIAPPSRSELISRLESRGTDSAGEIQKRLSCTTVEMGLANRYDYIVINDDIEQALGKINAIITAEKSRPRFFKSYFAQFQNEVSLTGSGGKYEPTNSR